MGYNTCMTTLVDLLRFIESLFSMVLPVLYAFAFLMFLWNAFRYFILGGANPESQEKARTFALWSILGFVVLFGIWGIVTILTNVIDIQNNEPIRPDYIKERTSA